MAYPNRKCGGLLFTEPKSQEQADRAHPSPLIRAIRAIRDNYAWLDQKRENAANIWEEHDLLFCQANGRPIDPRSDWEEFKNLLKEASIRDSRAHDGRLTAGTLLMEQGIDIRTVMEILGHSQMSVTKRYLHVSTPMAQETMRRMGNALWAPEEEAENRKPRPKLSPAALGSLKT